MRDWRVSMAIYISTGVCTLAAIIALTVMEVNQSGC